MGTLDARAAEDRDGLCAVEDFGRATQRLVVGTHHRAGRRDRTRRPSRGVGALQEDLAGDDDDGDATFLDCGPHRHLEDPRRHLRRADEFAVHAAVAEQLLRMRLLEVLGADLRAGDVRGDRQHRYAAALRVEQAVDQVQVARSAAACAHRKLSGQRGVGRGRETGRLLVTYMLPSDFTRTPQGVGETVEAVTGQPVHAANAADPQR